MTIQYSPPPAGMEPPPRERSDAMYEHALELAYGVSRRRPMRDVVLTRAYWFAITVGMGWMLSMVIDRTPPVDVGPRVVMNEGGRVQQGERLLVKSTRRRHRICELTRRIYIVDGQGRRHDYERETFDAYCPITPKDAPDEVETAGPFIPLDAAPGRGRSITILAHDCNALQRALGWSIVTVLPAVEFEIVARTSAR